MLVKRDLVQADVGATKWVAPAVLAPCRATSRGPARTPGFDRTTTASRKSVSLIQLGMEDSPAGPSLEGTNRFSKKLILS